ncbi:MAG: TlyA family RNA methyltransferase [Microbacteriaceae bacterium]
MSFHSNSAPRHSLLSNARCAINSMTNPAEFPRLDLALVERGLAESRTRAARLIDAGDVQVDGRIVTKAGFRVDPDAAIEVTALTRWVARSAVKLLAACERFGVDYRGRTVLDIGASTGGFTEVALSRGASRVIALDVGHGQIHPRIRDDYRVIVREGVNARNLTSDEIDSWGVASIDDVVVDVSFISLTHIITSLVAALGTDFRYIVLVKPQFEVGKGNLVDGVVRDTAKRDAALIEVCEALVAAGLPISGIMASPIDGEHGNREALVYGDSTMSLDARQWKDQAASTWKE